MIEIIGMITLKLLPYHCGRNLIRSDAMTMLRKKMFKVVKDNRPAWRRMGIPSWACDGREIGGGPWGVVDMNGKFINPEPLSDKRDAAVFRKTSRDFIRRFATERDLEILRAAPDPEEVLWSMHLRMKSERRVR